MAIRTLTDLEQDADFQGSTPQEQESLRTLFLKTRVLSHPEFQALAPEDKALVSSRVMAIAEPTTPAGAAWQGIKDTATTRKGLDQVRELFAPVAPELDPLQPTQSPPAPPQGVPGDETPSLRLTPPAPPPVPTVAMDPDRQSFADMRKSALESTVSQATGQTAAPGLGDVSGTVRPSSAAPPPRQATPAPQPAPPATPDFGLREDGTPKGAGWLGTIPMTDGSGRVMTEMSIGVSFDGKDTLIPAIVPTLTVPELQHLAGGGQPTRQIMDKAVAHAREQIAQGRSPFVDETPPPQPAAAPSIFSRLSAATAPSAEAESLIKQAEVIRQAQQIGETFRRQQAARGVRPTLRLPSREYRDLGVAGATAAAPPEVARLVPGAAPIPTVVRSMVDRLRGAPEITTPQRVEADISIEARKAGKTTEDYIDSMNPNDVVARDVKRLAAATLSGAVGAWGGAAEFFNKTDEAKEIARELEAFRASLSTEDPTIAQQFASAFGSTIGFYVPGMALAKGAQFAKAFSPTLGRLIGLEAASVLEAMTEGGAAGTEALRKGMSKEDAERVANRVFWMNVPAITITNKLGMFSEKGRKLFRVAKDSSAEGVQEWIQTEIGDVAAGENSDPKELLKSFAMGAAAAGTMSGVRWGARNLQAATIKQARGAQRQAAGEAPADLQTVQPSSEPVAPPVSRETPPAAPQATRIDAQTPVATPMPPVAPAATAAPAATPGRPSILDAGMPEREVFMRENIGKGPGVGTSFNWTTPEGDTRTATIQEVHSYPDGDAFTVQVSSGRYALPGTSGGQGKTIQGLTITDLMRRGYTPTAAPAAPQPAPVPAPAPPAEEPVHKYGNTMVSLSPEAASKVQAAGAQIADADLMAGGRESDPHITVRYGLKSDNIAAVRDALADVAPFTVTLGKTGTFPPSESSDNAGVVYVEASSPDLTSLHDRMSKTGQFTDTTFKDYKPHVTLAYVKPEAAKKYAGRSDLEGTTFTVDRIVVSDRDGQLVEIPLQGKTKAETPPPPPSAPSGAADVAPPAPTALTLRDRLRPPAPTGQPSPGLERLPFLELSKKSDDLQAQIDARHDALDAQGISWEEQKKDATAEALYAERIKYDTAAAQKAYAGARAVLDSALGDLPATSLYASRDSILREHYSLFPKQLGGAYFLKGTQKALNNEQDTIQAVAKDISKLIFEKENPNADYFLTMESADSGLTGKGKTAILEEATRRAEAIHEQIKAFFLQGAHPEGGEQAPTPPAPKSLTERLRPESTPTLPAAEPAPPTSSLQAQLAAARAENARLKGEKGKTPTLADRLREKEPTEPSTDRPRNSSGFLIPRAGDRVVLGNVRGKVVEAAGALVVQTDGGKRLPVKDSFWKVIGDESVKAEPQKPTLSGRLQETSSRATQLKRGQALLGDLTKARITLAEGSRNQEMIQKAREAIGRILDWIGTVTAPTGTQLGNFKNQVEAAAEKLNKSLNAMERGEKPEGPSVTPQVQAPAKTPMEKAPPGGWTAADQVPQKEVGKTFEGKTIYQDKNGARFIRNPDGTREYQSVRIVPTRAGVKTEVETPEELFKAGERQFLTAEEIAEFERSAESRRGFTFETSVGVKLNEEKAKAFVYPELILKEVDELIKESGSTPTKDHAETARMYQDEIQKILGKKDLRDVPADQKDAFIKLQETLEKRMDALDDIISDAGKPALPAGQSAKSFKFITKDGSSNAQRFATREEADSAGWELASRWAGLGTFTVVESTDPVNYRWDKQQDQAVPLTSEDAGPTVSAEEVDADADRAEVPPALPEAQSDGTRLPGALGGVPAEDVRADGGQGRPRPKRPGGVREHAPSDEGVGKEGRDVPGGEERRPGGVDVPSRREQRADPSVDLPTEGGGTDRLHNYRITEADKLGEGGKVAKYKDNIAAIRLLKALEKEGRLATPVEQAVLVRYVGWGGMPEAFEPGSITEYGDYERYSGRRRVKNQEDVDAWSSRKDELSELLTEEEYEAARKSTLNAHYTSQPIIEAIWKGVQRLGFKRGRILEPGAGVGHFLGLMPPAIAKGSSLSAVELDSLTGRMLKQLYQRADVRVQGFEETQFADEWFDASVGNWPFGQYKPFDPRYLKLGLRIHNYYTNKVLDLVKPGGVVAFITSTGTLDSVRSSKARQLMQEKAVFLGAVRLPSSAFKKNALTEVTTDIIFLQKRGPGVVDPAIPFQKVGASGFTAQIKDPHSKKDDWHKPTISVELTVNEYFTAHPENVLGDFANDKLHPGRLSVSPREGMDMVKELDRFVESLPQGVVKSATKAQRAEQKSEEVARIPAPADLIEGSLSVQDGKIYRKHKDDLIEEPSMPRGVTPDQVSAMIGLRSVVRDVFRTQSSGQEDDAAITKAMHALNTVYDRFVKRYGPINKKENRNAFWKDNELPSLLALENWDPDNETATKAPIFTKRTIELRRRATSAEDPHQAMLIALDETETLDFDRMAELTGLPVEQIQAQLRGVIYEAPNGAWFTSDEYLSGNVREKLKQAEGAATLDPKFQENVEALKKVQPEDLPPSKIKVRLGMPWVPVETVREFIADILRIAPNEIHVQHSELAGSWKAWVTKNRTNGPSVSEWGTERRPGITLISEALNGTIPTVYTTGPDKHVDQTETTAARDRLERIKDRFTTWIWEDPDRADALSRLYNDNYNHSVWRTFDGAHLTLPGKVSDAVVTLRPHQKNAIYRIVQTGRTLLDHVVGSGKTFTMVAAAMELRRTGLAKKPLMVVPNHRLGSTAAEWKQLYPAANILVAEAEDFEASHRKVLMARIATGDWDGVIVPESSFVRLPVSLDTQRAYINEEIDSLRTAIMESAAEEGKTGNRIIKQLEGMIANLQGKLRALIYEAEQHQDKGLEWERLGVDFLFVDEAHHYKNLFFATKKTRIAGLGKGDAQRATDMYLKVRHLLKVNNGRGIVFATGTPISNTLGEMFTLLRYLAPRALQSGGMHRFDPWAAMFAVERSDMEFSPDGRFKQRLRLSRFSNLPELMRMYRDVADVIFKEDVKLPLPRVEDHHVKVQMSAAQDSYYKDLIERADAISGPAGNRPDPKDDNMLKVTSDGRKSTLDMRLIDPNETDYHQGKINRAADEITRVYKETASRQATQFVFLDMGTPKKQAGDGPFNLYEDLRKKLVKRGIKAGEIAFIQEAKNDAEKQAVIRRMNAGKVRVLVGSTPTMGEGTNAQRKAVALHHIDPPWKPSEIEQRVGRIVRQGNEHHALDLPVHIYTYVTEGHQAGASFDAYMWQTLETKAGFIEQARRGDLTIREMDDISDFAVSSGELKALASGNPMAMEQVKTMGEIRRLSSLEAFHFDEQQKLRRQSVEIPKTIAYYQDRLKAAEQAVAYYESHKPEEFSVTIEGKAYTDREAAGNALNAAIRRQRKVAAESGLYEYEKVGDYAGLEIEFKPSDKRGDIRLIEADQMRLKGPNEIERTVSTHSVLGVEMTARGILSSPEHYRGIIGEREEALKYVTPRLGRAFDHAERLAQLQTRLDEINGLLVHETSEGNVAEDDAEDGASLDDVSDDLADRAKEIEPPAQPGLSLRTRLTGREADVVTLPGAEALGSEDPEVERRWKASQGAPKTPLRERARSLVEKLRALPRHFKDLDSRQYAKEIDILRRFESVPSAAKAKAKVALSGIVAKLGKKQLDVMTRVVVLEDVQKNLEAGLYGDDQATAELPFGYTADSLASDLERFRSVLAANPTIQDAYDVRQRYMLALREELVSRDLLDESVLEDDRYFHHQVLEYMAAKRFVGTSSQDVRTHLKGWQRRRVQNAKDFNTDYLEAEFEVVAQSLAQIDTHKALQELEDTADRSREIRADARRRNYTAVVGGPENMRRLEDLRARKAEGDLDADEAKAIKDEIWELDPTMPFRQKIARGYAGIATSEVAEDLDPDEGGPGGISMRQVARLAEQGDINARMILKAISDRDKFMREALGKRFLEWKFDIDDRLIPEGFTKWQPKEGNFFFKATTLADKVVQELLAGNRDLTEADLRTIQAVGGKRKQWVIPEPLAATLDNFRDFKDEGAVGALARGINTSWKQWTLLNPYRVLKYNLNNASGDLDIVLAADPRILTKSVGAAKDAWTYKRGRGMSPAVKQALEHGVIDSGLSITEVPDIRDEGVFRYVTGKQGNLLERYWNQTKALTNFRENILRLAAFEYAKQQIAKGKRIYWASDKAAIDAITDPTKKAAKLARELLGDYGGISHSGQYIRQRLIPFYSWLEINAPRYVRLFKNIPNEDGGGAGRAARGAGLAAARTTWGAGKLAVKASALFALVSLWNATFWPDEEEELKRTMRDRKQLHIILGRNPDGTINTIRFQGALSDALAWFSLDNLAADYADLASGKKTAGKQAKEMALAPVERIAQAAIPLQKTALETATGKSTYPNLWGPRPIRDRAEHVARSLSADMPYRYLAGKPTRGLGKDLGSVLTYTADPKEGAYFAIREREREFLEKRNIERPAVEPTAKSNALYYYRQAERYGDTAAAARYLKEYLERGGKESSIRTAWANTAPLYSIPTKYHAEFLKTLTPEDRQTLVDAKAWHASMSHKEKPLSLKERLDARRTARVAQQAAPR